MNVDPRKKKSLYERERYLGRKQLKCNERTRKRKGERNKDKKIKKKSKRTRD